MSKTYNLFGAVRRRFGICHRWGGLGSTACRRGAFPRRRPGHAAGRRPACGPGGRQPLGSRQSISQRGRAADAHFAPTILPLPANTGHWRAIGRSGRLGAHLGRQWGCHAVRQAAEGILAEAAQSWSATTGRFRARLFRLFGALGGPPPQGSAGAWRPPSSRFRGRVQARLMGPPPRYGAWLRLTR